MMEAGWSARRVARQSGRSDCVVRRCWDQWIREMSFTRRPGSGRLDRQVVEKTATSRLAEGHLGSRRPLRVLPLTPTHRRLRLEWCHARGNWTAAEWNQVVFSDEYRFNLSCDDNHVRVWRPRDERLNPAFALQRHTASTAGVIVWGAKAYNTRSPLVLIRGTMTDQRYVHDILQPHMLPLIQRLPGTIFQQDNARPHTARGCGSPVAKVSDHGRHVMSSSPVPLKTQRVGQRCTLNLSRTETSSRWCGVVGEDGASSGVVHVT
ncbi:transposable element Tcb2 transposase [Trichonephila clavipes]|nr:transposable element Tcb2 transposase [Trichonephila clavipes]